MQNTTKVISLLSLSLLTGVLLVGIGQAATAEQWFPSAGNEVQYKVSTQVTFTNQTIVQSDTFDIYRWGSQFYALPTSFNFYGRPDVTGSGYTSVENATTLTVHHTYFENTSTQLRRANSIWGRVTNYSNGNFNWIVNWNGTYRSISIFALSDHIIFPRTDYATNNGGDFVDYLPNYLGIGQKSFWDFHVIGVTSTATYHLSNDSLNYALYATDATGKVTSYSLSKNVDTGSLINHNNFATTIIFEQTTSDIPAYPVPILVSVVGIVTLYLIWSMKWSRKKTT